MAQFEIVTGFPGLLRGIRTREAIYGARVARGLRRAGAHLFREAQFLVPVDTGNMRGGGFVRSQGTGYNTIVSVGYVAEYSVYVHEDLTKRHGAVFNAHYAADIKAGIEHKRRPQEQAKFLETPLRRDMRIMAAIVRREVQRP